LPPTLRLLAPCLLAAALGAAEIPLGHPDYFPSPERPLGWRGDGTGAWPGAHVPTSWDARSGEGIAWVVDTPGAGLCQPVVAGEKVFVTADPNLLCCYRVHDGELLWQTAIDHFATLPAAEAAKARAEQAFWDERWELYARWRYDLLQLESRASIVTVGTGFQRQGQRLPYEGEEQHAKNLESLSGEDRKLYERLQREGTANGWCKQNGNNGPMLTYGEDRWPLRDRYVAAQKKWGVWYAAYNNWLGYTTYSFATPVTDGEYVYVTNASNAVAAVDYAGKIAWMVWERLPDHSGLLHTRHTQSPALLGGNLVVNQSGQLRVYDAATGGKKWEVFGPSAHAQGKKPKKNYVRGDPETSSPVACYLGEGSRRVGVVYDGAGHLWHLESGKLLAKGLEDAKFGTAILAPRDDGSAILISHKSATRLSIGDGGVETEKLWTCGAGDLLKFSGAILVGDQVIGQGAGKSSKGRRGQHGLFDLRTGASIWPFADRLRASSYITPIVAGAHVYAFSSLPGRGHDLGRKIGVGVEPVQRCTVASLEDGSVGKVDHAVVDDRFLGDDDWAIRNRAHGWGYQQNSSPSVQANRLFYRCRGRLYCIGDERRPFPTPRGMPAHAAAD